MKIQVFDICLETVNETDAEFILSLRSDEKRKRFLSPTDSSVEKQRHWIKEYKTRESKNEEFYFKAIDKNGISFGLYRIYKINTGRPEVGSWITKPCYHDTKNPIKLDIGVKDFVFSELNFHALQFEVRKQNTSVIKYHKMFDPQTISEDELNYYFILTAQNFNKNKDILIKKFKL